MKIKKGVCTYMGIFVLFFFFIRFIYMEILYQYTVTMFNFIYYYKNPSSDFLFVLFIILLLTYICTTLTYKLIYHELTLAFIKFIYSLYFLSLIYFLFFKTIGISGFNINPLNFFTDLIHGDSLILLMNILFFIPIGFLFKFNSKNSIIFLICIILIEFVQVIFSIGIFDIIDIILNYVGFVIGTIIIDNAKIRKFMFSNLSKNKKLDIKLK